MAPRTLLTCRSIVSDWSSRTPRSRTQLDAWTNKLLTFRPVKFTLQRAVHTLHGRNWIAMLLQDWTLLGKTCQEIGQMWVSGGFFIRDDLLNFWCYRLSFLATKNSILTVLMVLTRIGGTWGKVLSFLAKGILEVECFLLEKVLEACVPQLPHELNGVHLCSGKTSTSFFNWLSWV